MPKIVELRQDRNLIRSNFDGYKLSLESIPVLRQNLTHAPHKAAPNEEQYSLLHAELFSMQNLLEVDPWARTNTYFLNRLGEVFRSSYNENEGRPETLKLVYRLGGQTQRVRGDYNYSMRFISEKYCVLCDGINKLHLFDTGDRLKAAEWKTIASAEISTTKQNFTIYDCRLDTIQEQKEISLALGRVERKEVAAGASAHFIELSCAKWILRDNWEFSVFETLVGKGSLYYCAYEPRAESLIISSNHEFKFRSQSDDVLEAKTEADKAQLNNGANAEVSGFTWSQTDDDVVIKFEMRVDKEKSDYNIKCTATELTVNCGDETLLDHVLFAKVDQDLTIWTIEKNFLQITLVKQTTSQFWPALLKDGVGPKESSDQAGQNDVPMEQQPITNLEAPIEDCDFPVDASEEEIKIVRFHLPSKTITHVVLLASSPPLFATSLRAGFPLAIATRQDVDACLWLQQYNPSKPDEWSLRHEGNLHAFGYVQASKTQKKFMDCSPDLNYAVICESQRHVFLYKSDYDGANGLRNRNGPQVTLGKQHLITLEDVDEVLGIATASSVITLLTTESVLYLQII